MFLICFGQRALQIGDSIRKQQADQRGQGFEMLRLDHDVKRLRFRPERRKVKVANARGPIDGGVLPQLEPGVA